MSMKILNSLFATTALVVALPTVAMAQSAPADDAASEDGGEILVTARRGLENLQDVPVSVQVVSGDSLQKLAITSVEEVSKLAPGLTLVNAGSNTTVTLRGVTWQPGSGTPATPIYFNEIGFDPAQTIVSLYDVGQIEVLRGPQGTSRGAPSISGAVTISTRKPDLKEFGGYVQGQYGQGDHTDFQGAVNLPIIKDVLAIRLAANVEDSNGIRIESVNSAIRSKFKDRSYRATVLLKPTDTLTLQAMYQRRKSLNLNFTQVAGTGSPGQAGFPGIRAAIPANFNGPALTTADRKSVQDEPAIVDQHIDLLTVNADWEVFSHKLSYNFGRQFNRSAPTLNAADPLNILPGFEARTIVTNNALPKFMIHEVRISSLPSADRPFDYDIGWYSKHSGGKGLNFNAPVYLNGAFGNPITATPGSVRTPNSAYVLNSDTNILIGQKFDSFYGNVRFHIDKKTELSGGLAIVRDRIPVSLAITTSAALSSTGSFAAIRGSLIQAANAGLFNGVFGSPANAVAFLSSPNFTCEAARGFIRQPTATTSTINPGTCDVSVPGGPRPGQVNNDKYSKALYNFSLSHKFTDDLLVYATTGTSFRTGLPAINNPGLPANLVTPLPETATSYELGVKSSFGRGLTVNAAVFQLDYKDQLTTFEGVQYFNTVSNATAQTSLAFYRNIDARVRGFELEIAARPVDNLNLGAQISYSKIKSQGGIIPTNDPTKPINAANPINFGTSPKGQVLNTQAPFQATINGSYEVPFSDSFGGYFRFNINHQGRNPNFGNFRTGTAFKATPSYQIVDLFAGINGGEKAAWDIGFYAKNVFDKQVELARVATINSVYSGFSAPSGYDVVRSSRPREIGVTARIAFGSR
jgi:iron complex outermembrane recepter protein